MANIRPGLARPRGEPSNSNRFSFLVFKSSLTPSKAMSTSNEPGRSFSCSARKAWSVFEQEGTSSTKHVGKEHSF